MSDWAEFVERVGGNVRKIHKTADEGMYAKLYAADVTRLLAMLNLIESTTEAPALATVFEWTK